MAGMQSGDGAPDLNEIAERYDRMNDAALLDVGKEYGSLIPEVQSLLHDELARRGLTLPEPPPPPAPSTYPDRSNAALLREARRYDSLSPEAQTLLREEFMQRGLTPPLIGDLEESDDAGELEFRPLVKIRQYRDSGEAAVAQSALESAGIRAVLWDATTVRVDWLWSNMIGGVRLMVEEQDVEAAEEVLSQPIPESIALNDHEAYLQPHCPRCQSLDVTFEHVSPRRPAAGALISCLAFPLPPIPPRVVNRWKCFHCDALWTDDGETENATGPEPVG